MGIDASIYAMQEIDRDREIEGERERRERERRERDANLPSCSRTNLLLVTPFINRTLLYTFLQQFALPESNQNIK